MRHTRKHRAHALLALALLAALASPAQAAGGIPPLREEGALQYACGGIGLDESTAMRAAMKDYPLSLLFSGQGGEYLADVRVEIKGGAQDMRFTASGPVCLLRLPEGEYQVQATTRQGAAQNQKVRVGREPHTLGFRF